MRGMPEPVAGTRAGERRRFPRWNRSLNLSVAGHDRRGLVYLDPVRTLDVGRGGVSFPLTRPVEPGARVWVQLADRQIAGPPLERRGRICRIDRLGDGRVGRRVAVRFDEPLPEGYLGA